MTKRASALIVFLPASVADRAMSKRAVVSVLAARSARVSFGFGTDTPAGGVSATEIGASALTCQPPLVVIVRLAVPVAPTATLGSVFLIS